MVARASKTLMFWLVAACIAAAVSSIVSYGSADETQGLGECLSSFLSVEGCIEAIDKAVSDKKFHELKQPCCKAINLLGDNCWPILFPDQPLVPFLLKAVCKISVKVELEEGAPAPY